MNRILKNVMDSPKQDLFVKVLENLPPTRDMTPAETISKSTFVIYTHRGPVFKSLVQPLVAALIRSLMVGSELAPSIREDIKKCLWTMNQEDPQAFYRIVSEMGEKATAFVASLFS